jgi:ribonucleotide monophosphatase NagD (HAD superfamily)
MLSRVQSFGLPRFASCTATAAPSIVDKYDNWIFDCDGVLWSGGAALPGSVAAISALQAAGKNIIFVTNNSAKSRADYTEKFASVGFQNVGLEQINTSGSAAAEFCVANGIRKAFVVGESGTSDELELLGVETLSEPSPDGLSDAEFSALEIDDDVDAVVVGARAPLTCPCTSYSDGFWHTAHGALQVGTGSSASRSSRWPRCTCTPAPSWWCATPTRATEWAAA